MGYRAKHEPSQGLVAPPLCRPALTVEQTVFPCSGNQRGRSIKSLIPFDWSLAMTRFSAHNASRRGPDSTEEPLALEDTEDLPLSPEEDSSVIPDEERVFDMPS